MRGKKRISSIIIAAMILGLTGCGLFSEEESINDTMKVQHFTPLQHQKIKVKRGNLDFSETVIMEYKNQEEREYYLNYYYEESMNSRIKCYVIEGDFVKKGQLLAEAPCDELKEEKKSYQKQMETIQLDVTYNKNLLEIAENKEEKQQYRMLIEDGNNQIEVLKMRIREVEEKMEKFRIVADMDGQATKVRDLTMTYHDPQRPIVTVTSLEGYFKGIVSKEMCKLKEGDTVTAEISSRPTEMTVQDMQDITDGRIEVHFFAEGTFEQSSRAKLVIEGEKAENVLYIPKTAVAIDDEKAYVRIVAEDGFLRAKEVNVTGPVNGYYIVENGLQEGDEIINE